MRVASVFALATLTSATIQGDFYSDAGYEDDTLEAWFIGAAGTSAPMYPFVEDIPAREAYRGLGGCPNGVSNINLASDGYYDAATAEECNGISMFRPYLATNQAGLAEWPQTNEHYIGVPNPFSAVEMPLAGAGNTLYVSVNGFLVQVNSPVYGCGNTAECKGWSCATDVGPIPDGGFMPEYVLFNDTCHSGGTTDFNGVSVALRYDFINNQDVSIVDADYGSLVLTVSTYGAAGPTATDVRVGGQLYGPVDKAAEMTAPGVAPGTTSFDGPARWFQAYNQDATPQNPNSFVYLASDCAATQPTLHFQNGDTSDCFADTCGCFTALDNGQWYAEYDTYQSPAGPGQEANIVVVQEFWRDNGPQSFVDSNAFDSRGAVVDALDGGVDPAWFSHIIPPYSKARDIQNIEECAIFSAVGQLAGDVHFVSFGGEAFEVGGIHDRWHSVYSDANLAVNGRFVYPRDNADWRGSVIKQVSIVAGKDAEWTLSFHPEATEAEGAVTVTPRADVDPATGAVRFGECGSVAWTSESTLRVTYGGYEIVLRRMRWEGASGATDLFVNVAISPPGPSTTASGFLGETWHPRATGQFAPFPGEEADYLVSGPFALDTVRPTAFDTAADEFYWSRKLLQGAETCEAVDALSKFRTSVAISNDAEKES
jgi:hypothetical protein